MSLLRILVLALITVATRPLAAAGPEQSGGSPRGIRWEVSPSAAACLGIEARVDDLYILEIPRPANVTIDLTSPDPFAGCDLLLMAVDGEQKPRTIATTSDELPSSSKRITALLDPGKYYVGVAAAGEGSPYELTVSAPDLFGSASVDLTEKTAAECAPGTRPTIAMAETITRPPTAYEAIAQDIGINATSPKRRHAAFPPKPCTFNVSATTQSVTSNVGTGSLDVTSRADCGWGARSNTSWLTIAGATGVGNGTVSYSFVANTSTSSRTGSLTVAGKTVSITQFGVCSYTLSPTSKVILSSGGTGTVGVSTRSDCTWTATVSTAAASWITITGGQSGTGNGTVSYSVAANTSTSLRSGTINVGGRTSTIDQSPDISSCTYSPGYTSKTMTWCGGDRTIQVTTQGDCPWTATSDSSWLTIILPSRTGSRALSYTVAANTTGAARTAKLTINGTPVTITQNARSGSGTYDGNWTGTTGSNRAVSLCVAENAIQNVSISVRLDLFTFTCTTPLIRQQELAFSGNTFSGTFATYPEVSNVFTTVRGTFTSPTALNGSWDPFSGAYFIVCGSTIGIGSGGTILSSGTFTATKQP
ncbi:MAG: BACON domain-containing protein [Acidobacteriota bacterium]